MLDSIRIEALNATCATCGIALADRHRIRAVYLVADIRSFESQIELGILGARVRNYWTHISCTDPALLRGFNMTPDITHCIKCNATLETSDVVTPVFQVVDPAAINPNDPTDRGISLADRVYLQHADCKNKTLNNSISNILYVG